MNKGLLVGLLGIMLFSVGLAATWQAQVRNDSFVQYSASDQRANWQGRAPIESFELAFDDTDLTTTTATVIIRPERFRSGNILRDDDARKRVFEVADYPEIRFSLTNLSTQDITLPEGETRVISLNGNLDMHGVERPISVPTSVSRTGDQLNISGTFSVLLSDYDMTRPRLLGIVVDDTVSISFEITSDLIASN